MADTTEEAHKPSHVPGATPEDNELVRAEILGRKTAFGDPIFTSGEATEVMERAGPGAVHSHAEHIRRQAVTNPLEVNPTPKR